MRIIIIAIMALVILGGGGAGAYFYFQQSAQASVGEDGEHVEAKKSDKKKGGHEASHFVELGPLILPIVNERGVSQVVSLVIVLEVGDEAAAANVEHLSPRLRDAYIQDMYGVLGKKNALTNGMIEVGMIKERMNKISADVLGEDVVREVLLQVVSQRPI